MWKLPFVVPITALVASTLRAIHSSSSSAPETNITFHPLTSTDISAQFIHLIRNPHAFLPPPAQPLVILQHYHPDECLLLLYLFRAVVYPHPPPSTDAGSFSILSLTFLSSRALNLLFNFYSIPLSQQSFHSLLLPHPDSRTPALLPEAYRVDLQFVFKTIRSHYHSLCCIFRLKEWFAHRRNKKNNRPIETSMCANRQTFLLTVLDSLATRNVERKILLELENAKKRGDLRW